MSLLRALTTDKLTLHPCEILHANLQQYLLLRDIGFVLVDSCFTPSSATRFLSIPVVITNTSKV